MTLLEACGEILAEGEDLLVCLFFPEERRVTDSGPGDVATPTLVLTGGPLDGTKFPLPMTQREVVLGSGGQADVQIGLGNVDPAHAKLVFGPNGGHAGRGNEAWQRTRLPAGRPFSGEAAPT